MASPEKRCLYEVLGLPRDCTADEIRSAYRKLALQRHPDKLIKSGVTESEATAAFQELVNAYEVLSDVRERAWYDSHRSQILFSNSNPSKSSSAVVPDLFNFFSNSVFSGYSDKGKGFYKVYADVFDKIYQNELNFTKMLGLGDVVREAPLMGNLDSPYAQVNAFYGYWLGFVTVMDFGWADEYDAMAGPNRKSRRLMEEENKKIRKKAKREYNDTVRGLAEFVKKRDKRVIDMQMKRDEEMEKKKLEEMMRKKEIAREKAERARAYEEPDWARVEDEVVEEEEEEGEGDKKNELYCMACGKKFKSDKQWKNHEQSKKHKEKVGELREAFVEEDEENGGNEDGDDDEVSGDGDGVVSDDEVSKLKNQFEGIDVVEEKDCDQESESTEEEQQEEETVDSGNGGSGGLKGLATELGLDGDDDEAIFLEAMLAGHKSRKNVGSTRKPKASSKNVYVEVESEEVDLMEYNNKKGRRKRGGRNEWGKRTDDDEHRRVDKVEASSKNELNVKDDDGLQVEQPSSSQPCAENENNGQGDNEAPEKIKVSMQDCDNDSQADIKQPEKIKVAKQAHEAKVNKKKDASVKAKNPSKGKRQKATSKNSGHECDTCGVDFESRNKLHKHLGDTGHAALKSR